VLIPTSVVASTLALWPCASNAASTQAPCETAKLEHPLPLDGTFGSSVSLSGDRLVVGTPTAFLDPGRAFLYRRDAAGWTLDATLAAPDGESGDLFGRAVAVEEGYALVARQDDGILGAQGSVYAFTRSPEGQWLQTQKITIADAGVWAFGWSISMEGNRAAIGAKGAAALGDKGRVFIFELEGGLWVQKAKIAPSIDNLGDWFGASVDLDGDRLAVGAPKNGTGRAYVFDRQNDGTWVEQALFVPTVVSPTGDEYGTSVAVDGDTVMVGSIGHDDPYLNGGAVYVYEKSELGWQHTQKLSTLTIGTLPRFGYSLSLDGDELLVGSPTNHLVMGSAGAVYLFRRSGGLWTEQQILFGSEPAVSAHFGWSLSRDGEQLAVGAVASSTPFPGKVHLLSFAGGAHLDGNSSTLSNLSGGVQTLQLGACPSHAGDFYLLVGSVSGTDPALPVGPVTVPLVADAYLAYTLANPNCALLPGSLGVLDAWGRAVTSFVLPAGTDPALTGLTAHHAYVVFDSTTFAVELASNPVPVSLAP
jgi:hypothetical protein